MSTKFVKAAAFAVASTLAFTAGLVNAEEAKPRSLDQLLEFVKQGQVTEARRIGPARPPLPKTRPTRPPSCKKPKRERTRQENLSAELEDAFEANEWVVVAKQAQLKEKLGTLAELFGHLTSTAGDLASTLEFSLTSAQYPAGSNSSRH